MKLRRSSQRSRFPVPLSILLSLLWIGLVRVVLLAVAAQAASMPGRGYAAAFWSHRHVGGVRLPTLLMAVNLLLILYLWLDYRSRPDRGRVMVLVFLAAALLVVYSGYAVWKIWWSQVAAPVMPEGAVLTLLAGGLP